MYSSGADCCVGAIQHSDWHSSDMETSEIVV